MDRDSVGAMVRHHDRETWWQMHDKDEYVCPDCGRTNEHNEFRCWEVHHIDGVPGNVVGLCQTCHYVRHGTKRWRMSLETWKEEFVSMDE